MQDDDGRPGAGVAVVIRTGDTPGASGDEAISTVGTKRLC